MPLNVAQKKLFDTSSHGYSYVSSEHDPKSIAVCFVHWSKHGHATSEYMEGGKSIVQVSIFADIEGGDKWRAVIDVLSFFQLCQIFYNLNCPCHFNERQQLSWYKTELFG